MRYGTVVTAVQHELQYDRHCRTKCDTVRVTAAQQAEQQVNETH